MADHREFYVGYEPKAPRAIALRVRGAVFVLLTACITLATLLVSGQGRFSRSVFEFGIPNTFEGTLHELPIPLLSVQRPGRIDGVQGRSLYTLTVFGKRGAGAAIAGMEGDRVRLTGSLIYFDGQTMIEIDPDSIETLADGTAVPWKDGELGQVTLRGEIVDSKCFLGVMKPGNLKPHRACATRCISGGVPPVLLVRDASGNASYFHLVSESGDPVNADLLDMVAEPVEITGRLVRRGTLLLLHADPRSYKRI